jgi:hypothetical protein
MKELMWWIKLLRESGWACTWFAYRCSCHFDGCKERRLLSDWSWWLSVHPAPIPVFWLHEAVGGWFLKLGWFELWWLKPGKWMRHER